MKKRDNNDWLLAASRDTEITNKFSFDNETSSLVVLEDELDLAVGERAHLDVLDDALGDDGLAQAGQVLDDVVGLQADTHGSVEGILEA